MIEDLFFDVKFQSWIMPPADSIVIGNKVFDAFSGKMLESP